MKEILSDTLATAFGVIIAVVGLYFGWKAIHLAPAIETWLFPVVRVESVEVTYRDKSLACFTLHLTKLREAIPMRYEFQGQQKLSSSIGLSAYVAKADRSPDLEFKYSDHTHPVGSHWPRCYCFKMPGAVLPFEAITVTGHGEHRRHPLWESITQVPAFDIPALPNEGAPPG